MMYEQYSKKVARLIGAACDTLVIPDLILVKEGIACGDQIILSGEVDDGILLMNYSAQKACALCRASCSYFQQRFQNKPLLDVIVQTRQLLDLITEDHGQLFRLFDLDSHAYSHRYECLAAPLKLLSDLAVQLRETTFVYGEKPDTLETMECDACVSACRINWANQEKKRIDHHGNRNYGTDYLKKWLPLGKIQLKPDEIPLLRQMCGNMTQRDHQFLSDHTMNSFVLHHLLEHAPDLIDKSWKAASYLIQKNEINHPYIEQIRAYAVSAGLDVYFVKGYITQKYYQFPSLRIHSDYDIIAGNSADAFRLTSYLLKSGFTIRPNLFSLKPMNHNGQQVLSGHFHVQKIIDDTYMFELDITFPGFPINRVDLYYPVVHDNMISVEDQIVITLLHLFKHSNIYMKDINDLYYMLQQDDIDYEYLYHLLHQEDLLTFFGVAVLYIADSFVQHIDKIKRVIERFSIDPALKTTYSGWPYDKSVHLRIKQDDFDKRRQSSPDRERQFLYPVVMFQTYFDIGNYVPDCGSDYLWTRIHDTIYEITKGSYVFYLTPIGVFINNYIDTTTVTRRGYLDILETFLKQIRCSDHLPIPYATEHFYVRVI